MREIRYLDKLVDELARGKAMDKILRKNPPQTTPLIKVREGLILGASAKNVSKSVCFSSITSGRRAAIECQNRSTTA